MERRERKVTPSDGCTIGSGADASHRTVYVSTKVAGTLTSFATVWSMGREKRPPTDDEKITPLVVPSASTRHQEGVWCI